MITLEQIRIKLVSEIKESGLSQSEIARRLNIKQQAVSQYITGQTMPALDTFANLCRILDVSADEILGLK
ncbi:MAG: helix-turn-helix transcriptional regulator [Clostridiales bacterium]|nr:helix-turn-helix transcriptional regulator [Clostridiales bacterium]